MRLSRIPLTAALVMLATSAFATSPYDVNGFNTGLVFSKALEKARSLGGNCQNTPPATQEGGVRAQCEFAPCNSRDKDGACDPQDAQAVGLTIASQPIVRISLEAPLESAPVNRIVFIFDGRHDAVKVSLYEKYGPPSADVTPEGEQSWSRARRVRWTEGPYHLGLSDIPKLVTLEADQAQK